MDIDLTQFHFYNFMHIRKWQNSPNFPTIISATNPTIEDSIGDDNPLIFSCVDVFTLKEGKDFTLLSQVLYMLHPTITR